MKYDSSLVALGCIRAVLASSHAQLWWARPGQIQTSVAACDKELQQEFLVLVQDFDKQAGAYFLNFQVRVMHGVQRFSS